MYAINSCDSPLKGQYLNNIRYNYNELFMLYNLLTIIR